MAAPLPSVVGYEERAKGRGKAPGAPPVSVGGGGKGRGQPQTHADRMRDKDWMLARVARQPGSGALLFAHVDLRRDEEFVLAVVSLDGTAWWDLEESLQENKRIALAAISQLGQNGRAIFDRLPAHLRLDREVSAAAGRVAVLADLPLPAETEVCPSFDACRWIVTSCGAVGGPAFDLNMWTSPRHLVDATLPPPAVLEAVKAERVQCRGTGSRLQVNVEVCVRRLSGEELSYTVGPDDTASTLKGRLAGDLDVPTCSLVLLLGEGPAEIVSDAFLSTYCENGRPELELTLMVTLRDVCLLAAQGSRDEQSFEAIGVLMERALPGDQLAVDAAQECIRNVQWHDPHLVSALRVLQRLMPSNHACTLFAACLGAECTRTVAVETLHQLWHTEGQEFVALHACPNQEQEERRTNIITFLEGVERGAGPRRVFPDRPCGSHPCVCFGKTDAMEALRRGTVGWRDIWAVQVPFGANARLFRVCLETEAAMSAAACELPQNPSLLHDYSERYPVLVEALRAEAEVLDVCLEDILPKLTCCVLPRFGGVGFDLVMEVDSVHFRCDTRDAAQHFRSDKSSIDNLSDIAMHTLPRNASEDVRLVLEALTIVAPRSHRGSLTAACYASAHKDASVREQALELLLTVMQGADVDYVRRLLETRQDVHAKRILREVLDYFQAPERYVAEMGTYKLRYAS